MKSRKSGLFGTRSSQKRRVSASSKKSTLRKGLVESLEKRELLAGDLVPYEDGLYYPEIGKYTGDLIGGLSSAEYARRHAATSSGRSSSSGAGEDAFSGSGTTVGEIEPNDSFSQAQLIPLGTGAGQFPIVNIGGVLNSPFSSGSAQNFDEDWYRADLRGGDIVDIRLLGNLTVNSSPFDVTILDSSRTEIAGRNSPQSAVYPPTSPLSTDGAVSFAVVIPEDGSYFIKVSDGDSSYTMEAKVYRPTLEKEAVGTKQRVYVDFDGARVRTDIFGLPLGSVRLSPITSFFGAAGLQEADEERFIRSILSGIEENFQGTLPDSTNGYFSQDGIAGNFDIEFLNSFDHPDFDPDANEHVTKLIISGSLAEFPIPVRGISDSVDVGNFDTSGTVIMLPEVFMSPTVLGQANADWIGNFPIDAGTTLLDAYAKAISNTASHELGHNFGGWHQENLNANLQLLDSGGLPADVSRLGVGPDGVFGTPDDVDLDFGLDQYALVEGNFGFVDHAANMAHVLSTGTAGGATIMGNVFNDVNLSRTFDTGDTAGPGSRVFADANGNGILDTGEFFAVPNSLGQYTLSVPSGIQNIRVLDSLGWRLTTPQQVTIDVPVNGTADVNFGFERINLNFTGSKWNDINANGLRDDGENGIEGVWVYLDLDGDNRIDLGEPSDITDARGNYSLNFPGAGTFTIREVVPPGFVQTFPGPDLDNEHTVTLTGDPTIDADRVAGLNFGNTLTVDFGDALASYGVASHGFVPELRLGVNWDAEQASQHSADALGDDNNGASIAGGEKDGGSSVIDDEDGVSLVRPLVPGTNQIAAVVNNSTGASAFLSGWVDFNQNGTFEASEQVASDIVVGSGASQIVDVNFTAPQDVVLGNTFARFRLSSDSGLGPTGVSGSGEVEDYVFEVVADREFTINDTASVTRNSVLNEIDVLANDFKLPGEQLEILSNSGSAAGGIVTISSSNTILYTPPNGFIGQDTFTYTARNSFGDVGTANVTVDVQLFFDDPIAVDDSFDVAQNAIDFPLNVLANDIEGQNGALSIISITQPDKGGALSIATGGKSLRYTPLRGFGGTEFFTYTVSDGAGNQATAQGTLHTLPGDRDDDVVLIQLVARNEAGEAITAIPQGEDFVIDVMVDDLRFDAANPGAAAGVFAAYADILYNLQLVSANVDAGSGLGFDVEFFSSFDNGQRGDATVPGIIDDFGAFLSVSTLNQPDPVRLASIGFEARSPGIARFMPDPSDESPATDTLLFDTSSNEVPREQIRFIGTTLEIVGDGAQFPVAVDDSVPGSINQGSIRVPIDVLANDLPGSTGQISIASISSGSDNGGTLAISGNSVLYTPRTDFTGTDQFTYTIQDSRGIQSSATVTVRVGDVDANDIVSLELQVTDTAGNPIDEITVGSNFQLRGFVQDLRTTGPDLGIFAAYEDVLYSSELVSVIPSEANGLGFEVTFGPNYQRVREGSAATPGLINELGAVSTGDDPLGNGRQLFFTINLTANSTGVANFIADPADISPLHDTLTYEPVQPVPFDQIRYGFDSLTIVTGGNGGSGEGWHNSSNALDVNNDGFVSPIDALSVINKLNRGESGALGDGGGEGESGNVFYVDTNNDGFLSPVDALLVINFLNASGSGEGEALSAMLSSGSLAESADGVEGDADSVSEPKVINMVSNRIRARMTGQTYGPVNPNSSSVFDLSDIEDDEDEAMLDDLAADINGWEGLS